MTFYKSKAINFLFFAAIWLGWVGTALAQVEAPDRKHVFREDTREAKALRDAKTAAAIKADIGVEDRVDFKAPNVNYSKQDNSVAGEGGVIISRSGFQAQADSGVMNMESKAAKLSGDVIISTPESTLQASKADINVNSETGIFSDAEFTVDQGNYNLTADQANKLSELEYELSSTTLTTCNCSEEDADKPWRITSRRTHITQEGYAHSYDNVMRLYGVPVFYSPYLAFPVKQERQSGLLVGEYGYSSEDGARLKLPIFVVLDESTDITLTPFAETKTRYGTGFDYRQVYSKKSNVWGRLLYSNESLRDGDLRGTNTDEVFDPSIDTDRLGGFYKQQWRTDADALIPSNFLADVHLTSDSLFLRELEDSQIGEYNSRYLSSVMALRSTLGDFVGTELVVDFTQQIDSDQDLVAQRLPELNVDGQYNFRPFGSNPYGLKLVTRAQGSVTDFVKFGSVPVSGTDLEANPYDGWRANISPSVGMPFHIKNFVDGSAEVGVHQTNYYLNDTYNPSTNLDLEDSSRRNVGFFRYNMGTGVECAFDLEEGNWLTSLTSLGENNKANKLTRLKHTIEPSVKYQYIPDSPQNQDELPYFDSFDRIRNKNVFVYGFKTRLMGKFQPRQLGGEKIEEITPRIEDLPVLGEGSSLSEFGGLSDAFGDSANFRARQSQIRELVSLDVRHAYDRVLDDFNEGPGGDSPFSDITSNLLLHPTNDFALGFGSNYDLEDTDFASWDFSSHIRSDRGDALHARVGYQENTLSQIEGNAELVVTEQFKLGYYARYDSREKEFIEQRAGLRFYSDCRCFHVDLGYSDRINPDRSLYLLSFTFAGLGDLAQGISYR